MNNRIPRKALFLITAILTLILVSESWAMWHIILDEHFNRDPRENSWPWRTPGDPYYDQDWVEWRHNPRNWPSPPSLPTFTNCSWGWEDEIFNTHVLPDVEHQAAIWCALATERGPNAPQWPDEDQYWDEMNAWTWWGPFSLEDAESAQLSFWYFLDVEQITNDSLSAVIVNDPDWLTSNFVDFRRRCGFGLSFTAPTEDWQRHTVYMESLRVNGQPTSFLGEEECYIAFVWQSDTLGHHGMGAFIDDVIVAWDDGLFDLYPTEMCYGYRVDEDSIRWDDLPPNLYDEVCFKLAYQVEGSNEYTPSFAIECYIDDELFYSEEVNRRQGNPDTTYYSITDEFWVADSGEHLIRWEVDARGEVEEGNEDNNILQTLNEIEWDPAPQFEILTPENEGTLLRLDEAYPIIWTVSDSTDNYFDVYIFVTTDTAGYAEDHLVIYEEPWRNIAVEVGVETGTDTSFFTPRAQVDSVGHVIYVAGVATDGNPVNITFSIAPGTIEISLPVDPNDTDPVKLSSYSLDRIYPNPFNYSASVAYTLPVAGEVRLMACDLMGRRVATLVEGEKSAGRYIHTWQPGSLPAGIYLLKLETKDGTLIQKAVYLP